ncbi:glycosyl hydrolase [Gordonibacter sp. 28C]|nr:glycosyl hydrolase [Gordonibacter sp. 28C]
MSDRRAIGAAAALTATLLALTLAAGCSAAPSETAAEEAPRTEFGTVSDAEGSANPDATAPSAATAKPAPTPTFDERAAEKTAALTLEQKVAQLFVVRPEAITGVDTATQAGAVTQEALHAYPVGGIVYFQKNLLSADQTKEMIVNSQAYAQDACGLPLLVGVDEEGGTVSRIGGNPGFAVPNAGNMADVGAAGDPAQAQAVAAAIGGYLRELGFNLDFAPDADICGDPAVDVMALRSFGGDPTLVGSMVAAQVRGFSEAGVLCAAKHFPGIGGVLGDSHESTIVSNKTLDELRAWELVPFEAAIEAGVPLVMVGHLTAPNATGNDVPASINSVIVTDLLRGELDYEGLVITDSMGMGAVGGFCTPDQAGVAALQAGVDLVLMPEDFAAAYQGVLDAVSSGALSEERIDRSVTRIVKAKLALTES